MEVWKLPGPPSQATWDARVEDRGEAYERLAGLEDEHAEGYRRRVCSGCPHGRRVERDCSALTPGYEPECDHMRRAFLRKHGRLVNEHIELHPLFVRMRLNAELGARRREAGRPRLN